MNKKYDSSMMMVNVESQQQKTRLTLAAFYLEQALNGGVQIEIPSLGVILKRDSKAFEQQTSQNQIIEDSIG